MRDEWFIRGKVPMTKSEVRTVSLSKLELYEDCEFWDIGAGTVMEFLKIINEKIPADRIAGSNTQLAFQQIVS